MDEDPRELADTQFRFVPGFVGDGTESIQSVNYPGRYVRVIDGAVRIDPYEAGAGYAGQASFRRLPGRTGNDSVSLELAGAPSTYLRHHKGRLTAGPAAGAHSTFVMS